MVSSQYGTLLEELGRAFGDISLQPDNNNTCLLTLPEGIQVYIEMEKNGLSLMLISKLGDVPPGRYRINLFKEALKANALPYPTHGYLAYNKKTNQMVLIQNLDMIDLNGEKIANELTPFIAKATRWAKAIEQGNVPDIEETQSTGRPSGGGMFGLH